MAKVNDPVCGMMVDSNTASGHANHRGQTYYFCSAQCLRQFELNPTRFTSDAPAATGAAEPSGVSADASAGPTPPEGGFERHEPPRTKSGWFVAPKFGSAGSGGAEYERLPESHDGGHDKEH